MVRKRSVISTRNNIRVALRCHELDGTLFNDHRIVSDCGNQIAFGRIDIGGAST
jgi:hypothetical protein